MSLIDCPDCGTEVSDKASSCPKCGSPIATTNTQQKVLTEATAKNYKLIRLAGIGILAVSAAIALVGADEEFGAAEGFNTIAAGIGFVLGLIVLGAGLALSWWQHG